MPTTRQILTITGLSLLTGLTGYCIYFDYKRRNDPTFRRKLQREHRKLQKAAKASQLSSQADATEMLRAAVDAVNAEPFPQSVEDKETYFMEQVGMGEMLQGRLPQGVVPAAIAFFKAYKVYPSPQELIMIYQKTTPPDVFRLFMEMVKIDVSATLRARTVSGPSRGFSGDALLEELTGSDRAAALAAAAAASSSAAAEKPASSGSAAGEKSISSPAHSVAPSENGSGTGSQNGHSFVLVDEGASAAGAPVTRASSTATSERQEAGSLTGSVSGEGEREIMTEVKFKVEADEATTEELPPPEPVS